MSEQSPGPEPRWTFVCEKCGHHMQMHRAGCQHVYGSGERCDCSVGGLPMSEHGGLHPELRARMTTAHAALGDFHKFINKQAHGDWMDHAYRLASELRSLLEIIERRTS